MSRSTAAAGLSLELALKISTSALISPVSGMGILSIPYRHPGGMPHLDIARALWDMPKPAVRQV
ncbi:MAG: hypothetical protein WBD41_22665, partial [Rhodococcus sp. (in: high G+C Gram-positive bacteria)]